MARILVIDDDEQIRFLLQQMLEQEGFEVDVAQDGRIGMMLHRKNPAELVITDIIMPDQEGLETIQQFRQEFPKVKIIAISGGGRIGPESYLVLAKKFGAMKTFVKPIDRDELLEAIQELLNPKETET